MQKLKSYEHENKQLKDIQENLNSTLNRVKSENENIINNLKLNLSHKETEYKRLSEELQDKNHSTKNILDKEKENSEFKATLMQNTLNDFKQEVARKSKEHEEMLYDNKKL